MVRAKLTSLIVAFGVLFVYCSFLPTPQTEAAQCIKRVPDPKAYLKKQAAKYTDQAIETVLNANYGQDGQVHYFEVISALVVAERAYACIQERDYVTTLKVITSLGTKHMMKHTLSYLGLSTVARVSSLAAVPITYAVEKAGETAVQGALDFNIKVYSQYRDDGITHEEIIAGKRVFHDNGWLIMARPKRYSWGSVRPIPIQGITPADVYELAKLVYEGKQKFDADKLTVLTAVENEIKTAQASPSQFTFRMKDGTTKTGELREHTINVRSATGMVTVSGKDILSYRPGELRLKDGRVIKGEIVNPSLAARSATGYFLVVLKDLEWFGVGSVTEKVVQPSRPEPVKPKTKGAAGVGSAVGTAPSTPPVKWEVQGRKRGACKVKPFLTAWNIRINGELSPSVDLLEVANDATAKEMLNAGKEYGLNNCYAGALTISITITRSGLPIAWGRFERNVPPGVKVTLSNLDEIEKRLGPFKFTQYSNQALRTKKQEEERRRWEEEKRRQEEAWRRQQEERRLAEEARRAAEAKRLAEQRAEETRRKEAEEARHKVAPSRAPTSSIEDYLFLSKKGARWVYDVTWDLKKQGRKARGILTIVNEGETVFEGTKAIRLSWNYTGGIARQSNLYFVPAPEGPLLLGSEHTSGSHTLKNRLQPPVIWLKEPLRVGSTWESQAALVQSDGKTTDYRGSNTVQKQEQVTVPVGQFEALKIVYRDSFGSGTSWLAKGVGYVRREESHPSVGLVAELVEYSIPGKAPVVAGPVTRQEYLKQWVGNFSKKYRVADWLVGEETDAFFANPFPWKGKIVGLTVDFWQIVSADSGLFSRKSGGNIPFFVVIRGLPPSRVMRRKERFLVAAHVEGVTQVALPFMGMQTVPELRLVGMDSRPASIRE